eukprot:g23378.t1
MEEVPSARPWGEGTCFTRRGGSGRVGEYLEAKSGQFLIEEEVEGYGASGTKRTNQITSGHKGTRVQARRAERPLACSPGMESEGPGQAVLKPVHAWSPTSSEPGIRTVGKSATLQGR